MPAPSPAIVTPATELAPQPSTTGTNASCASSQRCSQPIAFDRLMFGTTPWCSSSRSAGSSSLRPPATKRTRCSESVPSASSCCTRPTMRAARRASRRIDSPLAKYGERTKSTACAAALRHWPRGVVSSRQSIRPPTRASCAATRNNSGPVPASTTRPSGTRPEVFSSSCAAPAVMTPGNVQPGIGKGRSSAPVARITCFACTSRATPSRETPISKPSFDRVTAQTVAPGACVAPARANSPTSPSPCQ